MCKFLHKILFTNKINAFGLIDNLYTFKPN